MKRNLMMAVAGNVDGLGEVGHAKRLAVDENAAVDFGVFLLVSMRTLHEVADPVLLLDLLLGEKISVSYRVSLSFR
jgi:hypothetical protein